MAHFVLIDDIQGDLIDIRNYCSDYCAREDSAYAGWNGCNELEFDETCEACGDLIKGYAGPNPDG